MDYAEIGEPCREQAFLDDPSREDSLARTDGGCTSGDFDGTNCDACQDIDKNESGDDSLYISP